MKYRHYIYNLPVSDIPSIQLSSFSSAPACRPSVFASGARPPLLHADGVRAPPRGVRRARPWRHAPASTCPAGPRNAGGRPLAPR